MMNLKSGCSFNGFQALNLVHGFRNLVLYSTSSSSSSSSSSLLANYLVESLGFSAQQSLSTSTRLSQVRNVSDHFKVVSNANAVIDFFKKLGLDKPQIQRVIKTAPRILMCKVDKTLKPKVEILQGLGLFGSDLSNAIFVNPSLLLRRLSPFIHTLRQVMGSDQDVVRVLMKCNFLSMCKCITSNVEMLKKYGIPDDIIKFHIMKDPKVFLVRTQLFEDRLARVEQELGIARDSSMFMYGIRLLLQHSEKTIESKFQVLKSFGWAQSDILELMRKVPNCLGLSEAMLNKKLDFLMSELGYKPAYLVSNCAFMTYSLQKRLVPRHKVLLVLKEKGLINMDYSLTTAVKLNHSQFVDKFVLPYKQVHEVYAKHVGISAKLLTQGRLNDNLTRSLC